MPVLTWVVIERPGLDEDGAADMAACRALEAWALLAALEPGSPVFRAVDQHNKISAERLSSRTVSRVVEGRKYAHAHARVLTVYPCRLFNFWRRTCGEHAREAMSESVRSRDYLHAALRDAAQGEPNEPVAASSRSQTAWISPYARVHARAGCGLMAQTPQAPRAQRAHISDHHTYCQ
jgi:hypothetical protein